MKSGTEAYQNDTNDRAQYEDAIHWVAARRLHILHLLTVAKEARELHELERCEGPIVNGQCVLLDTANEFRKRATQMARITDALDAKLAVAEADTDKLFKLTAAAIERSSSEHGIVDDHYWVNHLLSLAVWVQERIEKDRSNYPVYRSTALQVFWGEGFPD